MEDPAAEEGCSILLRSRAYSNVCLVCLARYLSSSPAGGVSKTPTVLTDCEQWGCEEAVREVSAERRP